MFCPEGDDPDTFDPWCGGESPGDEIPCPLCHEFGGSENNATQVIMY
jgi:hypothetical protein